MGSSDSMQSLCWSVFVALYPHELMYKTPGLGKYLYMYIGGILYEATQSQPFFKEAEA